MGFDGTNTFTYHHQEYRWLHPTKVTPSYSFFFFFLVGALGLHCCVQAFSSCGEWGLLFVVMHRPLIMVISFIADRGL